MTSSPFSAVYVWDTVIPASISERTISEVTVTIEGTFPGSPMLAYFSLRSFHCKVRDAVLRSQTYFINEFNVRLIFYENNYQKLDKPHFKFYTF